MKTREKVLAMFTEYPENTLILASKEYRERFSGEMTEEAYYQTLGRLCKSGDIARISKGVYCRPKVSRFGTVLPSDREIVRTFTENEQGVIVGYSLYNSLKLTTQIPKRITVYSSLPEEQQKQIGNVTLQRYPLEYTPVVCSTVQMLDVLHHYEEIQEKDSARFLELCQNFTAEYDDSTADYVLCHLRYPKRTIAFLREILDYAQKSNGLGKYLSSLSTYQYPRMEALYESARASGRIS